jgi:chemotaxis protein MotA
MLFALGLLVVVGSVLGGYLPHGALAVLWQPLELLIILSSALGAFMIANPASVQLGLLRNFKVLVRASPYPRPPISSF